MARKSLRPHLNQIRAWTRQGRTDAWVAHQLEVTVQQIASFKREAGLLDEEPGVEAAFDEEIDLRAADDEKIAAELEAAEKARLEEEEVEAAERARLDAEAADTEAATPKRRAAERGAQPARRSRVPSITARRATGCGSIRPSSTTPSMPSTGRGSAP